MQSPPFPRYLFNLRSNYSPQHHVLKHLQLPFLLQCQRPSFTLIQNNRQNYSSIYILIFNFWIATLIECTFLISVSASFPSTSGSIFLPFRFSVQNKTHFLILSFRRVLYAVCFLLGNSTASEF